MTANKRMYKIKIRYISYHIENKIMVGQNDYKTRISLIRPKVDTIQTMMVDQKVDKNKNNPEWP